MADEYDQAAGGQLPGPDPALKKPDRFVGTWEITGRTLARTTTTCPAG